MGFEKVSPCTSTRGLDCSGRQLTCSVILLLGFPVRLQLASAHAMTLPLLRTGIVLPLTWMEAGSSPTQKVSYTTCHMCMPALCNRVKNGNLSGTEVVHSRTYCYLFCSFATLTGINNVPLIAAMIVNQNASFFNFQNMIKTSEGNNLFGLRVSCLGFFFLWCFCFVLVKLRKHLVFPASLSTFPLLCSPANTAADWIHLPIPLLFIFSTKLVGIVSPQPLLSGNSSVYYCIAEWCDKDKEIRSNFI